MIQFQLGQTLIQVWPDKHYLQTVYRDGTYVPAAPQDTEEYRQRARDLGYGENTWLMCVEHEICHTLLAMSQGRVVSPALWNVAHSIPPGQLEWDEEAEVLEFQRKFNACRIPS